MVFYIEDYICLVTAIAGIILAVADLLINGTEGYFEEDE